MSHHVKTAPRKRRKIVVATAAVGVLAAAGGAFAFWTGGGSGSGAATTSAGVTPIVVNQSTIVSNLAPGSPVQTLSGNFTNTNSGPVYIGSVTISSLTVTKTSLLSGTCDSSDYTLGGSATVDADVPTGTNKGSWSGLTIAFNNKSTNQDACKGALLTINYSAS